jgi:hypothetical protein
MKGRLVKWDAAELERAQPAWKRTIRSAAARFGFDWFAPKPDPLMPDVEKHPACVEIIDLSPGEPPNIRYRRPDPCL